MNPDPAARASAQKHQEPSPATDWVASWQLDQDPCAVPPNMVIRSGQRQLHVFGRTDLLQHADHDQAAVLVEGRIHNARDLEKTLNLDQSRLDQAAVVLASYLRWGDRFLERIRGIFALAVWNKARDTLLLGRDQIGIYSLFLVNQNQRILFSPTISGLLGHLPSCPAVNRIALAERLYDRWSRPEETFFADIQRVPQGQCVKVEQNGLRLSRYWDPLPPGEAIRWASREELEAFPKLFEQAVARCLDWGRPGIFLSGGLDSVSVAALAADLRRRQNQPPPRALSLAFPDPECNEVPLQEKVARDLRLPQTLVPFHDAIGRRGLLQATLEMSARWPQPLFNYWLPAYYHLADAAKRLGCDVILTGAGGDEWLTVSPTYAADLIRDGKFAALWGLLGNVQRARQLSPLGLARHVLWVCGAKLLLREVASGLCRSFLPGYYQARRCRKIQAAIPDWLAPDPTLRRELQAREESNLPPLMLKDFYLSDVSTALRHPLMSMEMEESFEEGRRLGLRILHPFWDVDLVEFLFRVSPCDLFWRGRDKGLVRRALVRQFPSWRFLQHRKILASGFFRSTIIEQAREARRSVGELTCLQDLGLVRTRELADKIEGVASGQHSQGAYLFWDLLNLETWLRNHV